MSFFDSCCKPSEIKEEIYATIGGINKEPRDTIMPQDNFNYTYQKEPEDNYVIDFEQPKYDEEENNNLRSAPNDPEAQKRREAANLKRDLDNIFGKIRDVDPYDKEGWREFYEGKEGEDYFHWNKEENGPIDSNQVIIKYKDGIEKLQNVEIYEGDLNSEGQYHGDGVLSTSKFVREGTFRNGEFSGWNRDSKRNNGDVTTGRFENGKIEGYGISVGDKGTYKGPFINNIREGDNAQFITDTFTYTGRFDNNRMNGQGKYETANGKFEGQFKNNSFWEGDYTEDKNGKTLRRSYAGGEVMK